MKDVPFEVLQTPVTEPVPFSEAGDPFEAAAEKTEETTMAMPAPFLSADRFQSSPAAENVVYASVFGTMLCSFLGWLILYPREILTGLAVVAYSIGDGIATLFGALL